MTRKYGLIVTICAVAGSISSSPSSAQNVLPKPEQPYVGFAGRTPQDSSPPHWPARIEAPKGAPNVLLIMTDDVGFAAGSTFGGPIPTPTQDALAKDGLRYTEFHTTAVCSPTRAALLTGRNHHLVGMATVPEGADGYEGYVGVIPRSAGTLPEILKGNGYNTAMFGKWHLTPTWERSQSGPFDHWPTHMGFEYYYGFIFGATDQFAPALVEGTKPIEPPHGDPSYILDRDLADHAIGWIRQQKSVAPDKPFFVYYAPGTSHAPHQAPKDWIQRFKGKFDQGWDKVREETFERQKKLGIVPPDTKLTPRQDTIPAWDSLSADQKLVYAHEMEVYAAALSHCDYQIGRIIDTLKEVGALDNTIIIYIQGDNGASSLGGLNGSLNDEALMNVVPQEIAFLKQHLDEMGGPKARNEYSVGWGHAMDTPFQWWKAVASHFGGTRNGMVISWPVGIKDKGTNRPQFHHVIDIMPTILEAAKVEAPDAINGVAQLPIEGSSMVYSFDHPTAPSTHTTQYFEIAENIAIYHDGWVAATTPLPNAGMIATQHPDDLEDRRWELYDISHDYSEADDLAAKEPRKLRELRDLFWAEAARNHVLPIHRGAFMGVTNMNADQKHFVFYPGTLKVPEGTAPVMQNRSFEIAADVDIPDHGANGMLATQGGRFGGFGFYLADGKLVYDYNFFNMAQYAVRSPERVPAGHHLLAIRFKYDGGGLGKGGTATLLSDGKALADGRIDRTTIGIIQALDEGFDIGEDTGTPIDDDYEVPFSFTGTLHKVSVSLQ
ncbi:MAG TPA: arylsulfatase [Alphaproteobacteria bacterium]|nr:arylsulfatase [Alphaproteobacteria bacterium]